MLVLRGTLQRGIGEAAGAIGEFKDALLAYRAALDTGKQLAALDGHSHAARAAVASAFAKTADLLALSGSREAALDAYREARAIRAELVDSGADAPEDLDELGLIEIGVAKLLSQTGEFARAQDARNRARRIYMGLAEAEPGRTLWQTRLKLSLEATTLQ